MSRITNPVIPDSAGGLTEFDSFTDHIHIVVSIPPKYAEGQAIGS
jgi:hypothetical protein